MPPFSKRALDKPMFPAHRTYLRQWLFAMLVGGVAAIARAALQPILGDALPFLFAFPATALVALLWGTLPGLAAAAVCAVAVWMPWGPPNIAEAQQPLQLGLFAVSALMTSTICGRLRSDRPFQARARPGNPRETALGSWLQAVLWGALLLPLSAFVAASWWSLDRAEAASASSLSRACDLALRHAERTFTVAQELARRADEASQVPNDQARAREADIHVRLSDMVAGTNAVVNANVWTASGNILARSDRYPVDPAVTIADRGYFQRLQAAPLPVAISEVMVGRQTGKRVINVAIRRHVPDESFNGIVTVTLAPSFFSDYYQSLAHEDPILATFALVRSDGAVLARWPDDAGSAYLAKDSPLMALLARGDESGRLAVAADAGRGTQQVKFARVGALPVYVIAGVSHTAMLANWARVVGVLAAILLPITSGLVYVTWVALRKTRTETVIAAELQDHIRARAQAERRMLEAQRLETLSFVTGSVAHDFNNLLAVITSSLHVHKMRRPDVAEDTTLAAISRSVQAGVRLTRQLLSFSKKQALRPEVIRFQAWLPAADTLLRSTLGSTASWTSSVDADTRPVKVDLAELELALINVVLNAKLAMPAGGQLSVHVSNDTQAPPDAPSVIVCVIDTGEGIAPEVMPRVFEPFFTTRERGVGSGLGLTQVQAFCAQSGGRVTIESTPGKGTTLCMHLPATTEGAGTPVDSPPEPVPRLQARLLLVDDNEEVGKTTEQMLRSSGMTVERVTSADAALALLATASPAPQVVLSDIAMPGSMNGIGLALELRRLYPQLPVLLHTGYADQIEQANAKGLRVFQKPVPPEILLAELRSMIQAVDQPA